MLPLPYPNSSPTDPTLPLLALSLTLTLISSRQIHHQSPTRVGQIWTSSGAPNVPVGSSLIVCHHRGRVDGGDTFSRTTGGQPILTQSYPHIRTHPHNTHTPTHQEDTNIHTLKHTYNHPHPLHRINPCISTPSCLVDIYNIISTLLSMHP